METPAKSMPMGKGVDVTAVEEVDVVVIGGGLSGLSAAHRIVCKDASLTVLVLEAKDRLGGRTLTVPMKAANNTEDSWDLGGQWVSRTQLHVMGLLEELGIDVYPQHTDGVKMMRLSNNRLKKYRSDPSLSPITLIDLYTLLRKFDKMGKQVPSLEDPTSCKYATEWDQITVAEFIKKHTWSKDVRDIVSAICQTGYGAEPEQVSLLFMLSDLKSAGGLQASSTQELKIKGGAQQLSLGLAEKIGMEKVLLEHPVTAVHQDENSIILSIANGKSIRCKRVILAVPPQQITKMNFSPCLPSVKTTLFNQMPGGHIIKIIVTYEKAFWGDSGYSGEIFICCGERCSDGFTSGPLNVVFDATSHQGNPALVAFICARKAVQYSSQTAEQRKEAVLQSLVEFLGEEASNCVDFSEKDWHQEPYNGGGPGYIVTPGVMNYFSSGLRNPFKRIHFAGSESATAWAGYMDGAIQSGQRAATEVLYELSPQTISPQELSGTAYDTSGPKSAV